MEKGQGVAMSIIGLKDANCKNCYKCVKVCPVKSIKVVQAQAKIIDKDCILCGRCLSECPQNAKTFASDIDKVKALLKRGEQMVVSLAPSYVGSFDFKENGQMVSAIKKLGFFGVSETAQGAALVSAEYHRLAQTGDMVNIITTCCPTVNDLIEKYYPEAAKYMAPVVSPMIAHGKLLKKTLGAQVKVVFIGPCIAKKGESGDIRHDTQIDAVLTFDDLYQWLQEEQVNVCDCEPEPFLNCDSRITKLYPVSAGVLKTISAKGKVENYDMICVDGIEDCKELLAGVIDGTVKNCMIEMNACSGGCINGPARGRHHKTRFQTKLELENKVKQEGAVFPEIEEEVPMAKQFFDRSSREKEPDEADIRAILQKIGKETPDQELNCGLCGYNSCREKAKAVYQGKAELTMCIPFMRQRAESLSNVVLAQTPNITIIVDEELNIVEFNTAAETAFGCSRTEALTKGLYELIDVSDFQEVFDTKKSIYDKKVVYDHFNIVTTQNLIYIAEDNLVMGIFNDITEEERRKESRYHLQMESVDMAQKVIEKQMMVAQQIAGLLGETTAETKVTLTKLKDMIKHNGDVE